MFSLIFAKRLPWVTGTCAPTPLFEFKDTSFWRDLAYKTLNSWPEAILIPDFNITFNSWRLYMNYETYNANLHKAFQWIVSERSISVLLHLSWIKSPDPSFLFCLIRPRMDWPDVALGHIKHGFVFLLFSLQLTFTCIMPHISTNEDGQLWAGPQMSSGLRNGKFSQA